MPSTDVHLSFSCLKPLPCKLIHSGQSVSHKIWPTAPTFGEWPSREACMTFEWTLRPLEFHGHGCWFRCNKVKSCLDNIYTLRYKCHGQFHYFVKALSTFWVSRHYNYLPNREQGNGNWLDEKLLNHETMIQIKPTTKVIMLSIDFWSLTTNELHFRSLEQNISCIPFEISGCSCALLWMGRTDSYTKYDI